MKNNYNYKLIYREDGGTGDLTPSTSRALGLMEGLTGASCELAYKLCPGRWVKHCQTKLKVFNSNLTYSVQNIYKFCNF